MNAVLTDLSNQPGSTKKPLFAQDKVNKPLCKESPSIIYSSGDEICFEESTSVKISLSSADEIEEPVNSYYTIGNSMKGRKKVFNKRKSSNGSNSTFSFFKERPSNVSLSIAGNSSDDDFR